jgi:hypothetical protein
MRRRTGCWCQGCVRSCGCGPPARERAEWSRWRESRGRCGIDICACRSWRRRRGRGRLAGAGAIGGYMAGSGEVGQRESGRMRAWGRVLVSAQQEFAGERGDDFVQRAEAEVSGLTFCSGSLNDAKRSCSGRSGSLRGEWKRLCRLLPQEAPGDCCVLIYRAVAGVEGIGYG